MDEHTNMMLAVNEAVEHRRIAAERLAEASRRLQRADELARESRKHGFSIVRAVSAMTADGGGGLHDGVEAEVAQECARLAGRHHDPHRPVFPWSALRAMNVGNGTDGGYLVDGMPRVPMVADALAPWSITIKAGVTVLPGLTGDVQIPREAATGTAQWLATEVTAGTAANMTFTAASLKPKNAIALMELSGRLLLQGPLAEQVVQRSLARAAATLVDQAVIAGTSTDASVPLGLLYQSGITVTTGTSLTFANLLTEQEAVALKQVQDGAHAWVGHPTVRKVLSSRACGTQSSTPPFLWTEDRLLNRPAYVTTDVGTGRIVHGDWSQVAVGFWGPGFALEHNPYANFQAGIHAFRICLSCDVGVMSTGAMRVLTAIS